MAFTYLLSNNIGLVRLLIPDNVEATPIFQDADITAFLALEGGSVKLGAAQALETLASNQAMLLKVIKLLDLQTDGAKLSDALLKRAALLRDQVGAEIDLEDAASGGLFDWAEQVVTVFNERERIEAEWMRGAF